MTIRGEVLYAGEASGAAMRLDAPISFWGGVDPQTSRITLGGHPQNGQAIRNKMLVMPELVGSSSSSAILLELIYCGIAPLALVLGQKDAILPVGVVVAAQMGWPTIPVVLLADPPFVSGQVLTVKSDGTLTVD